MNRGMNLPDTDHVIRHVSWQRLRKDEDINIIGFLPEAFALRAGEPSLSVNWVERFEGVHQSRLEDTVREIRAIKEIKKNSAFAIGNVGHIKSICHSYSPSIRIVYAPSENLPTHSEIRKLPRDDLALLSALADEAFVGMLLNTAVI